MSQEQNRIINLKETSNDFIFRPLLTVSHTAPPCLVHILYITLIRLKCTLLDNKTNSHIPSDSQWRMRGWYIVMGIAVSTNGRIPNHPY